MCVSKWHNAYNLVTGSTQQPIKTTLVFVFWRGGGVIFVLMNLLPFSSVVVFKIPFPLATHFHIPHLHATHLLKVENGIWETVFCSHDYMLKSLKWISYSCQIWHLLKQLIKLMIWPTRSLYLSGWIVELHDLSNISTSLPLHKKVLCSYQWEIFKTNI